MLTQSLQEKETQEADEACASLRQHFATEELEQQEGAKGDLDDNSL